MLVGDGLAEHLVLVLTPLLHGRIEHVKHLPLAHLQDTIVLVHELLDFRFAYEGAFGALPKGTVRAVRIQRSLRLLFQRQALGYMLRFILDYELLRRLEVTLSAQIAAHATEHRVALLAGPCVRILGAHVLPLVAQVGVLAANTTPDAAVNGANAASRRTQLLNAIVG